MSADDVANIDCFLVLCNFSVSRVFNAIHNKTNVKPFHDNEY